MTHCAITLKPIARRSRHPDYLDASLRAMFGTTDVDPVLPFSRKEFAQEVAPRHTARMSISGMQQKLSIKLQEGRLRPTETEGTYILKPTPEQFPEASANEHLSMLIGARLGIETPPCGLVRFSDGEFAYLVKRFDRVDGHKLNHEDMAALLGLQRDPAGRHKYASNYEEVARGIREATGGRLASVRDFFIRVLHAFLIANGDYHLKNIALLLRAPNPTGVFDGLTPQYDSLHTRCYFPDETVFALPLLANHEFTPEYDKLGYYTRADFDEFARRIGLPTRAVRSVYAGFHAMLPAIHGLIDNSFLGERMRILYRQNIEARGRLL